MSHILMVVFAVLSALLEARGLPSNLFGALGPRMHQLLHRSVLGGSGIQHSHVGMLLMIDCGTRTKIGSSSFETCFLVIILNEILIDINVENAAYRTDLYLHATESLFSAKC